MQLLPVLKCVKGSGIGDVAIVSQTGGIADAGYGVAVMVVAENSRIARLNSLGGNAAALLAHDPLLELKVARFVGAQVGECRIAVNSKTVQHHLVEAPAALIIVVGQLASRCQ